MTKMLRVFSLVKKWKIMLFILFILVALSYLFTPNKYGFSNSVACALICLFIAVLPLLPEILYLKRPAAKSWKRWARVNGKEADRRKSRASSGELTPIFIDTDLKFGRFAGSECGKYLTTLCHCSCPDFRKRKVPCKHMYYLASEMHLTDFSEEDDSYIMQENVKSIQAPSETDTCNDNMNYMVFKGDGIFLATRRKRKICVEAFSEEEARSDLAAAGYDPSSLNISRSCFEPPTEAQLNAMREHGDKIPKNACKLDLSFLMTKIIEHQRNPETQLMQFATDQKVKFSYYIGEKSLYSCIWDAFDIPQCIAFYLLCVKKDITGKWKFDLWENYLQKANDLINSEKFMNSFKRYLNSGFYGFADEASSRSTNCYKMAREVI